MSTPVFPMDEAAFVDWANRIRSAAMVETANMLLDFGHKEAAEMVVALIDAVEAPSPIVPFIPDDPQNGARGPRSLVARMTDWLA